MSLGPRKADDWMAGRARFTKVDRLRLGLIGAGKVCLLLIGGEIGLAISTVLQYSLSGTSSY